MALYKSEFPVLEYSDEEKGVVMPKQTGVRYSQVCVMAFFHECIEMFIEKNNGREIDLYHSESRDYQIYAVEEQGVSLSVVQAPVGSASAANMAEFLFAHGVEALFVCGSCGVLENIEAGRVLVPDRALRDEGPSYKYLPPARFIELNRDCIEVMRRVLERENIKYIPVVTWTNDALYRETPEMVAYRKSEGCQVVEMECASMAAVAKANKKKFGQLLYSGDILFDKEKYDRRDYFKNYSARELLFYLTVETAKQWNTVSDED